MKTWQVEKKLSCIKNILLTLAMALPRFGQTEIPRSRQSRIGGKGKVQAAQIIAQLLKRGYEPERQREMDGRDGHQNGL